MGESEVMPFATAGQWPRTLISLQPRKTMATKNEPAEGVNTQTQTGHSGC